MRRGRENRMSSLRSRCRPPLFRGSERNMCVFGRHQVAHGVLVFAVGVSLVEPMLEMFASRGGKLRKEQSGAALIARPDYIGVSVQRNVRSGQHTAERQARR